MAIKAPMTAAELLAILEKDPVYQEKAKRKAAETAEKHRIFREDVAPLAEELRQAGWNVTSPWDLVNTPMAYESAIPVLLRHLDRPYLDRNREGIARALAVKEARHAWTTLRAAYENEREETGFKEGLAVALSVIAKAELLNEVIELIRNPENGPTRSVFVRNLRRSRSPEAKRVLEELAGVPDLAAEIGRPKARQ
jgi:hypothetical protein